MHSDSVTSKLGWTERRRLKEVARIKGKLIEKKLTLAMIDEHYNLPARTAGNAVHEPHLAGERAIAAALDTLPHLLWPSRYFADGRRKSPQPPENYRYGRRAAAVDETEAA
ncbi:helix-turn-helix domain-containing protein [Shinella yambaruensis]|uniref:Ner winged helix-turn-helix DNA-binding domain-containing protein n=1 Tax=Shinella yambaruensis TaxID=415996 RepID=A0ABQ5ZF05_9HYPH|nr:helix-turn-helix domain-containing protein [Shinella yambaruensis]MCJ8027051.1 helix-turn-helix domain-containing protein [Shinella yambaruensis]MCU7982058.1 helix-turn-helix domain-containing protein [Shinella yambaruensis]GLR51233.1 hypothetical protein GCM10007923_24410 [Shinella yambaruensis]